MEGPRLVTAHDIATSRYERVEATDIRGSISNYMRYATELYKAKDELARGEWSLEAEASNIGTAV